VPDVPGSLTELAAAVAVHPAHLARCFRREYGQTVGEYARALRLEWAAEQLALDGAPLAEIALREIVPGDILELQAGNLLPADATLLSAVTLSVDQAALTGESLPVEKRVGDGPGDPLAQATRTEGLHEALPLLGLGHGCSPLLMAAGDRILRRSRGQQRSGPITRPEIRAASVSGGGGSCVAPPLDVHPGSWERQHLTQRRTTEGTMTANPRRAGLAAITAALPRTGGRSDPARAGDL